MCGDAGDTTSAPPDEQLSPIWWSFSTKDEPASTPGHSTAAGQETRPAGEQLGPIWRSF
jgi:hypothetical protein